MTPADLHRALGKGKSPFRPFRPFKLRLTDGREIVCDDQDRWCIGSGQTFAVAERDRDGFIILSADQIAEVVFVAPNPGGK